MIIVSACQAGFPCRYDGKSKPCAKIMELLKEGKAVPVCPEQLGGMPTPRPPCEINAGRVMDINGIDNTDCYLRGAQAVLEIARMYGVEEAWLQSRSPSCGSERIYDGTFSKTLVAGDGITAQLLKKNGIKVISIE